VTSFLESSTQMENPPAPGNALKNLIDFKSYCISAYPDIRSQMDKVGTKQAGELLHFMARYGEDGRDNGSGRFHLPANIIVEYSNLLAQFRKRNPFGLLAYLFDKLNDSLLSGKGVLKTQHGGVYVCTTLCGLKYGELVMIDHKALGLTQEPAFVKRIAQLKVDYYTARGRVEPKCVGADVKASGMFLQNKIMGHYQSFFIRQLNKNYAKMAKIFNGIVKISLAAEKKAFVDEYTANRKAVFAQVYKQATAGRTSAQAARDKVAWIPPSIAQMKIAAKKAAAKWLKHYTKRLPKTGAAGHNAAIVKKMVDEATGVKFFMYTGLQDNAQSDMKPKVTVVGTQGTIKGQLRSVPGHGEQGSQHIASKMSIGDIKKVIITGDGSTDGWYCRKIGIRMGPKQSKMIPLTVADNTHLTGFWLNGTQSRVLKPDSYAITASKKKVASDDPHACFGFRATRACNASAARNPTDDKKCTTKIDSSMSGYCECGSGPVSKVDCGHRTFKCVDLCKV